jgi:hypothetical protein
MMEGYYIGGHERGALLRRLGALGLEFETGSHDVEAMEFCYREGPALNVACSLLHATAHRHIAEFFTIKE